MSINVTSIKCPECGASLPLEEGRTQVFCSYCGNKIVITNDNEHIYRHIDEAKLKQAETEKVVRMRELDIEEQSRLNRKTLTIVWLSAVALLFIFSIVFFIVPNDLLSIVGILLIQLTVWLAVGGAVLIFKIIPEQDAEKRLVQNGGIRFPKGLEPFVENNYEVVKTTLINAGFTNISCVNLNDVKIGLFQKQGMVEKITVMGKEITTGGKVYSSDVPIIISYHGKREK